MNILTSYNHSGYKFTLIEEIGQYKIFQGVKGNLNNWEVQKIRKHKSSKSIKGKVIYNKGDEYGARDDEWGEFGWSLNSLEECKTKIQKLMSSSS